MRGGRAAGGHRCETQRNTAEHGLCVDPLLPHRFTYYVARPLLNQALSRALHSSIRCLFLLWRLTEPSCPLVIWQKQVPA